ncbi:uncharacterized protein LOC143880355 isoform X2 [Tasmannia lanceolata]|uniref:uncharacterized protein LOC143880355 isoform X2 n=1 Tax=Tasmannia lanceolata TaxID=3420 RepID=UPI004064560D
MGHRDYLFSPSRGFVIDDDQTRFHHHPEPSMPMEHVTVNRENFNSHRNLQPRSNDYRMSSLGPEMAIYGSATSATSYDPNMQTSAAGNFCPIPTYHVQPASSSSYYGHATYGDGPTTINPSLNSGRDPHKRKRPAISPPYGPCPTSRNYSAGSSSSLSISSDLVPQEKPSSGSQHWAQDPIGIASNFSVNSPMIAGEGSHRNVRSRTTLHLEANPAGIHLSGNPPQHFYPAAHHPIAHSSTGNLAYQNASSIPWDRSHVPMPPATGERFLASGSSMTNGYMETGRFHGHIQSSNPGGPLQSLPPGTQAMRGQSSYVQRLQPTYREFSGLGYGEPHTSSRQSRPHPTNIVRRNNDRNGRARISYHRLQSLSEQEGTRDRLTSEDVMLMMDHSAFYGSRNFLDQYMGMRLDVDNMSYEELLALEERIGNVSTGLSEHMISKCLKESMFSSEEETTTTCVICLEEYNKKERVSALDCGHNYHRACIEKWLSIKSTCPVCKTPAVADTCCKGKE